MNEQEQENYEYIKKIATQKYYEFLCDFVGVPQRPHNKEEVVSTYVDTVLSQLLTKPISDIRDAAEINMLYQMFIGMKISKNGRVVAQWNDRKGCSWLGLVAGAIGLLLGITLF